jgi:PIN domain nuclease of toxin-antitoxin system
VREGVLLDTQAMLYWLAGERALPNDASVLIGEPKVLVYVSAASIWETAIKVAKGKLRLPDEDLPGSLEREGFELLHITPADCWSVRTLPDHHADPFDRMIIAQARDRGLPIITGDSAFSAYDVEVLW